VAGAAALTGAIAGFLFGIPHTIAAAGREPRDPREPRHLGNTNLEVVSDWLTKIIVGVGLIQLGHALPALARLGRNLRVPLGGQPSASAFGLALVISYAALGFLFGYLWSREKFPGQLRAADVLRHQLADSDQAATKAFKLVTEQLNSLKGGNLATPAELNQVIAAAPALARILCFTAADNMRAVHWRDDKPRMATAIPVFRALIAADGARELYQAHGALGWALKDQESPEWQAAAAELTEAIQIRDRLGVAGWKVYEATRALCHIKIVEQMPVDSRQSESLVGLINEDLAAAVTDSYASRLVAESADIQVWIDMLALRSEMSAAS